LIGSIMKRLFIAVDLPAEAIHALVSVQPGKMAGVRPTKSNQMHLTLHFLGDADPDRVLGPLSALQIGRFSLAIEGVGSFTSRDGDITLWAGIVLDERLRQLHTSIAEILKRQGFTVEKRPYKPHITLARCRRDCDRTALEDYLAQHTGFAIPAVPLTSFSLISSRFVEGVPVYAHENIYPLTPAPPVSAPPPPRFPHQPY
jgi:2'-5' RNA ligase